MLAIKILAVLGFGKIIHGLLYPCFQRNHCGQTVFVSVVKKSKRWREFQNHHSTIISKLISYDGNEISEIVWLINAPNETFDDFVRRCFKENKPGLWIYENSSMLKDAIENSTIVGTSVGIDAFDDVLNALSELKIHNITVYAFENKPDDIRAIANKYEAAIDDVVCCPIDRVVVSREIDIGTGIVSVKLGLDPSEMVMIYDKNDIWKSIINAGNDQHLIITKNSESLNCMLKKKLYGKNFIHKLLCQIASINKEPSDIANLPLHNVIQQADVEFIDGVIPSIIVAVVVNIFSEQSVEFSKQSCLDIYSELKEYAENAKVTIINDVTDTIGRIIHLDTYENAQKDLQRLLSIVDSLKNSLTNSITPKILNYLREEIGDLDSKTIQKSLDVIIQKLKSKAMKQ